MTMYDLCSKCSEETTYTSMPRMWKEDAKHYIAEGTGRSPPAQREKTKHETEMQPPPMEVMNQDGNPTIQNLAQFGTDTRESERAQAQIERIKSETLEEKINRAEIFIQEFENLPTITRRQLDAMDVTV